MAKQKVSIETKEVAWTNGEVTKWQTIAECRVSKSRTVRIVGEPMSTRESALDAFKSECEIWRKFLAEINGIISK